MTLRIDQAVVEATARDLLHHHNAVEACATKPRAVDTGQTSDLTVDAVADVVRRAGETADGLFALVAGLEATLQETGTADGSASLALSAIGQAVAS